MVHFQSGARKRDCAPGDRTPKKLARDWIGSIELAAYGVCGLTPAQLWNLTPRDLRVMIECKLKIRMERRRADLWHMDRLFAVQTARLLNIQGKTLKEGVEIDAASLYSFKWDIPETEEPEQEPDPASRLEEIRQKMNKWVKATGGEING
jgi:hypothetical protein